MSEKQKSAHSTSSRLFGSSFSLNIVIGNGRGYSHQSATHDSSRITHHSSLFLFGRCEYGRGVIGHADRDTGIMGETG